MPMNKICLDDHHVVRKRRVQIFNSSGAYLSQFGGFGTGGGQFINPTGVAIDPVSHDIFVTDYANNNVQIFNSAGIYLNQYRKSHAVEVADALIAACAVGHRAELWTRNRKHYPMKEVSFFD